MRQEATANLCLGTRAAVWEKVGDFFSDLTCPREEVKRRCRTVPQAKAEAFNWPAAKPTLSALQM